MHIALLEDEPSLAEDVKALLTDAGHTVSMFLDGPQIMMGLRKETFDLFVLDWQVPSPNGLEVLEHIRKVLQLTAPVMFLTSHNAEEQIVQAFDAGADDYCAKPLRVDEFMARLGALQRRLVPPSAINYEGELAPGYVFDGINRTVAIDGQVITLTEKEYELSRLLFVNIEKPLARTRLMYEVWGREEDGFSRTLDVHISWIRRKLNIGAQADRIRLVVVHGFGYRLMKMPPRGDGS
jgi:DNA-binding response OmpR family regulator